MLVFAHIFKIISLCRRDFDEQAFRAASENCNSIGRRRHSVDVALGVDVGEALVGLQVPNPNVVVPASRKQIFVRVRYAVYNPVMSLHTRAYQSSFIKNDFHLTK